MSLMSLGNKMGKTGLFFHIKMFSGIIFDNKLIFYNHVEGLSKKVSETLSALSKNLPKKSLIFESIKKSQFSY